MSNLADNLVMLRKDNGLTQEDIANLLGISRAGYSRYETSGSEPSVEGLITLANVYKVSIDFLVGRDSVQNDEAQQLIALKSIDRKIELATSKAIEKFLSENKNQLKMEIIDQLNDKFE